MLFPRTIFADKNDMAEQMKAIRDELDEVERAIESGDWDHAAVELVDGMVAINTALFIAKEKHGADSYGAFTKVSIKNARRGYYGDVKGDGDGIS